jgi:hypothetical protein
MIAYRLLSNDDFDALHECFLLASIETSEPLKINNIDEDLKGSLAFYEANGYKQVLAQYELIKTL